MRLREFKRWAKKYYNFDLEQQGYFKGPRFAATIQTNKGDIIVSSEWEISKAYFSAGAESSLNCSYFMPKYGITTMIEIPYQAIKRITIKKGKHT